MKSSIVGLGLAGLTREATPPPAELARQAVVAAAHDAGLPVSTIDGLVVCRTSAAGDSVLGLDLQRALGLRDLALNRIALCEGASALAAIQLAALAVSAGAAKTVACVFADTPVIPGKRMSASFGRLKTGTGVEGLRYSAGLFGGAAMYALSAMRYLAVHGLGEEVLADVAITTRRWAALNPQASYRKPLSYDDYFAGGLIASSTTAGPSPPGRCSAQPGWPRETSTCANSMTPSAFHRCWRWRAMASIQRGRRVRPMPMATRGRAGACRSIRVAGIFPAITCKA